MRVLTFPKPKSLFGTITKCEKKETQLLSGKLFSRELALYCGGMEVSTIQG